jgi:hypothetical protein
MPKKYKSEGVLHPWVNELTFQMQALLLTGMRGPDGSEKHNSAKAIVRYLRGAVIKPAGHWSGQNNNDFMWGEMDLFSEYVRSFWEDHDEYPHHFIMHLIHCAEVLGYKHPSAIVRTKWIWFYRCACGSFHMSAETEQEMDSRLNDFGTT